MKLIDPSKTVAELMTDPETVAAALSVLRSLQSLELVLNNNGVVTRHPIKLNEAGAVLEVVVE